jgi:hypothetical protein
MNALDAAKKMAAPMNLKRELVALFDGQNTKQRRDATSIPAAFLRVTVQA